eukprot:TRINITY_DN8379_c0_g1_i1.p1 TRINITY_DN8379_c0_g1~~TRINITY_DN8379_c0_g1_i1.p1  ORF type:complete len:667 (+),score=121.07 TRINITY_DN8379_c0_g1_i1:47-2047(+)
MAQLLQFESWNLFPEVQFWSELSRIKLHEWRDRTPTAPVFGTRPVTHQPETANRLAVGPESFAAPPEQHQTLIVSGQLLNTNTIEEFQRSDRKKLLQDAAKPVRQSILDGSWVDSPQKLNSFVVLSFADLKAHKYFYLVGFPALLPPESFRLAAQRPISEGYSPAGIDQLRQRLNEFEGKAAGAFVVWCGKSDEEFSVQPLSSLRSPQEGKVPRLAVIDTSTLPTNPGWPLRNLLLAVAHSPNASHALIRQEGDKRILSVICLRISSSGDLASSLLVDVEIPAAPVDEATINDPQRVVGWEPTPPGKKNAVHVVDLSAWMDPTKLAASAASLNLSLMKWRNLPGLDIEALARMKCLLVGSGTLGCNVARNLMMWGVLNITFLDYGKISYSNPVRQTLFEFADCTNGSKHKALAAADACRRIHPGAQTFGHVLSIPMPGHPIDAKMRTSVEQDVAKLTELTKEADAIFILTDSRESRWLPTLLGTVHDKLVINAGLGFASYTVMRHGSPGQENRLGCYFCNDLMAPRDSLSDRTLDQQCTVTRPGVSAIASALAVELFAATVQHPLGTRAPAEHPGCEREGVLGLVPHQIRGDVLNFEQSVLALPAFSKCTACSAPVQRAFEAEGFTFIEKVLNQPEFLEEITGWKEEQHRTEEMIAQWEENDEDDF